MKGHEYLSFERSKERYQRKTAPRPRPLRGCSALLVLSGAVHTGHPCPDGQDRHPCRSPSGYSRLRLRCSTGPKGSGVAPLISFDAAEYRNRTGIRPEGGEPEPNAPTGHKSSGHLQSGERPDRYVRAGAKQTGTVRNAGYPGGASRGVPFSFAYFFYSAHPCASPLRGLRENPLPADFWASKRNRLAAFIEKAHEKHRSL